MNNVKILLNDICKAKLAFNERSCFRLAGVGNLSVSDLNEIEDYAKGYESSYGVGFSGLVDPVGTVRKVLERYNIL